MNEISKAKSNVLTTKHNALTAIHNSLTKHNALTTRHNRLKSWCNATKCNAFTPHWQCIETRFLMAGGWCQNEYYQTEWRFINQNEWITFKSNGPPMQFEWFMANWMTYMYYQTEWQFTKWKDHVQIEWHIIDWRITKVNGSQMDWILNVIHSFW